MKRLDLGRKRKVLISMPIWRLPQLPGRVLERIRYPVFARNLVQVSLRSHRRARP